MPRGPKPTPITPSDDERPEQSYSQERPARRTPVAARLSGALTLSLPDGRETWRRLRVLNRLGVTRGTVNLL